MSPTRRPSAAGLRMAVTPAPNPDRGRDPAHGQVLPPATAKPVRVTLNIPPDLYRQLARWCDSAAESTGVPRVGQQDALRAMVRVIVSGEARNAESHVLAEIQRSKISGTA